MTAYGGNLTVFHRFLFSGASVEDSELIMKGGGLELHYMVSERDPSCRGGNKRASSL